MLFNRKGFTLLEIMLAVAILGLVGISIHRFVGVTLSAIGESSATERERETITAFADWLRANAGAARHAARSALGRGAPL